MEEKCIRIFERKIWRKVLLGRAGSMWEEVDKWKSNK
jgi:hypothetical protein